MVESEFPIEVEVPDISAYRVGNTGVDYVTTYDSGRSGPHVMVSALVHGNEVCGAIVLDWMLREGVRPVTGSLTLAFVNVSAYARFDPNNPAASRFVDEDFNRLWSDDLLDGSRQSVELGRARELRPVLDSVDLLLDLHSMQQCCVPMMMCGPAQKGRALALALGVPSHVVVDSGHAAGRRMRDYARFLDPRDSRNALLVECGQHWTRASADVARDATVRFLHLAGIVDDDFLNRHPTGAPEPQRVVEVSGPVTIETERFRFVERYRGMEVIPARGTVIGFDGDREIRTPFDECVLIMPSLRLRKGESAVRFGRYVQ